MNQTIYGNINDWFDRSNKSLIKYGYMEDKPQCVVDIIVGYDVPCNIPTAYGLKFLFNANGWHTKYSFFVFRLFDVSVDTQNFKFFV